MSGCVVAELGVPALTSRATLGPHVGCTVLEQHALELAPGGSAPRNAGGRGEVLFVLSGRGSLRLGGTEHALEPESGAYLALGESYELRNPGDAPLRLVAVSIPDPAPPRGATGERGGGPRLARQGECAGSPPRKRRRPRPSGSSGSSPIRPAGCARRRTSSATSRRPARPTTCTSTTR